jgi:hypothetical protein
LREREEVQALLREELTLRLRSVEHAGSSEQFSEQCGLKMAGFGLPSSHSEGILWVMRLRLDLLEHLTDQDILEEVLANNHRYKPEPNFSKTGVGTLSSASIEERAQEEARSTALIERLKQRSQASGQNNKAPSSPSQIS